MRVKLEVVRGAKHQVLTLRLPSVVGRGGTAKVKLPASTVSRHHCEVYEYEGQIVVRDVGSSNGTYVNGHKIEGPTFLSNEDELTVGPMTARLSIITEQVESPSLDTADSQPLAPSFDTLPVDDRKPTASGHPEGIDSSSPDMIPSSDDSVLYYSEADGDDRSFLGIAESNDEGEVPKVETGDVDATNEPVSSDDSALSDFFRNLGDE